MIKVMDEYDFDKKLEKLAEITSDNTKRFYGI